MKSCTAEKLSYLLEEGVTPPQFDSKAVYDKIFDHSKRYGSWIEVNNKKIGNEEFEIFVKLIQKNLQLSEKIGKEQIRGGMVRFLIKKFSDSNKDFIRMIISMLIFVPFEYYKNIVFVFSQQNSPAVGWKYMPGKKNNEDR